jgi:hypothetical protein
VRFIREHKSRFGVEPICRVLTQHGCPIAPSTHYDAASRPPSARARRPRISAHLALAQRSAWGDAPPNPCEGSEGLPGQADVHQLIVADLRHLPITMATSRDSASTIGSAGPSRSSERWTTAPLITPPV